MEHLAVKIAKDYLAKIVQLYPQAKFLTKPLDVLETDPYID